MWNSEKNVECRQRYHKKKSATKVFQVCISIVYDRFFWNLALALVSTALLLWRYGKIRTSFKTLVSKKTAIRQLKKSYCNDKLWEKITSSSYHMEQKTFIEASCIYNIHTGENHFCSCYFWKFVSRLDSDRLKNVKCTLVCTSLFLILQRQKDQIILFMWSRFKWKCI